MCRPSPPLPCFTGQLVNKPAALSAFGIKLG
jgi:hypothetical protein